jgi:SAM-dependent methyltransferase
VPPGLDSRPAMATTEEILDVNRRYHDVAAVDYDSKWGVDFGPVGRGQVIGKVEKLLGRRPGPFERSLEIGSGTGYFTLNLMQEGVIRAGVCTDVSPGMLDALEANARRLGLDVETVAADASALPFEDASFDLVLGHAVLHHLPELGRSFAEFMRVLRPGGVLLFAGEPSRYGDRIAALPKRAGLAAAPLWRRAVGARAAVHGNGRPPGDHSLEPLVAVHAFTPADLERHATAAGFAAVSVRGEELLANMFGWFNRTVEASAVHSDIPLGWFRYAFRGYIVLQKVDSAVLEPHLPAAGFYNLMLTARKPG